MNKRCYPGKGFLLYRRSFYTLSYCTLYSHHVLQVTHTTKSELYSGRFSAALYEPIVSPKAFFVHGRISPPPISVLGSPGAVKSLLYLPSGCLGMGQPSSLFRDLKVWENFRNKKRHLFLPEFSVGSKGDKTRFFFLYLAAKMSHILVSSFQSVTPCYTDNMIKCIVVSCVPE